MTKQFTAAAVLLLEERGKLKQHQMMEFAGSRNCRWNALLDYFGSDGVLDGTCGRCDRCAETSEVIPARLTG